MTSARPLTVAVVGAGPAGIYAADTLVKSGTPVAVDVFEKLPAPYGLVRYGVAPDHPRIKLIIEALYRILAGGEVRLIGNVEIGKDITLERLSSHYDAVILATGSDSDADLDIPGADLPEVYGASKFVYWYDGHPDYPRTWPLEATDIAVVGVGNVALDVARILTKPVSELMSTDIPDNVAEGLAANPAKHVHLLGRRGPAQAKFTPMELRELGEVKDVDIEVRVDDFDFDEASEQAMADSKMTRQCVTTMVEWTMREEEDLTAPRRIHLSFYERPVEILGEDGHVTAIRTERTAPDGEGRVVGTGEFTDTPVQAVYLAVGYYGTPVPGAPFDAVRGVIPNVEGRVVGEDGEPIPGLFATGWVKRGPVGLIGSTKSDALQTVTHLISDFEAGTLPRPDESAAGHDAVLTELEANGVRYTTEQGWLTLDRFERDLGEVRGRARMKVVERETMTAVSRDEEHDGKLY